MFYPLDVLGKLIKQNHIKMIVQLSISNEEPLNLGFRFAIFKI